MNARDNCSKKFFEKLFWQNDFQIISVDIKDFVNFIIEHLLNSILCNYMHNNYKILTNYYEKKANQREEEYKNQIKTLTTRLKEVQSKCVM